MPPEIVTLIICPVIKLKLVWLSESAPPDALATIAFIVPHSPDGAQTIIVEFPGAPP